LTPMRKRGQPVMRNRYFHLTLLLFVCLVFVMGCGDKLEGIESSAQATCASCSKDSRKNLELAIFRILVGLILKNTLDVAFKTDLAGLAGAPNAGWRQELVALFLKAESFEFCVFLPTLLRFVYGAYRFHEAQATHPPILAFSVDALGL